MFFVSSKKGSGSLLQWNFNESVSSTRAATKFWTLKNDQPMQNYFSFVSKEDFDDPVFASAPQKLDLIDADN